MDGEALAARAKIAGALWLETVGSTNDRAKDWVRSANGARTPYFIGAERQTAGRGRGDHSWAAWDGALTFSLAARWNDFRLTRRESAELSLRVADAVASTAREFAPGAEVSVKPPNDVYARGRKLAGILIESPNSEFVVVGVGVNVGNRSTDAPEELRSRVVSLAELADSESFDVDAVRAEFAILAVRRMLRN
ncbi:MAG: biotin--[Thermoguttaceae bacterium]|nr:biotin--[acetyl-CoA-carboxylase] ligase [Thermoguttaceae bacterium]